MPEQTQMIIYVYFRLVHYHWEDKALSLLKDSFPQLWGCLSNISTCLFLSTYFLNYCSPSQPIHSALLEPPVSPSVSQAAGHPLHSQGVFPSSDLQFICLLSELGALNHFGPVRDSEEEKYMPLKSANWQRDWERGKLGDVNLESRSL